MLSLCLLGCYTCELAQPSPAAASCVMSACHPPWWDSQQQGPAESGLGFGGAAWGQESQFAKCCESVLSLLQNCGY